VNSKEIRELIELISRSNFATFELEREGFKLRLVKEAAAGTFRPAELGAGPVPVEAAVAVPAAAESPALPAAAAPDDGLVELRSPIVGTFYLAPGPTAPPFVEVGSRVRKGQVMCIVEAMKVMNEIESEIDAEVAEIVVASAQPVEFGEVLFRLRPLS